MSNSDQDHMFNILDKQRKNQLKVDRILKIVLPLTAFLLSVICANLNWQSTLGTFVILTLAFLAVGIQTSKPMDLVIGFGGILWTR